MALIGKENHLVSTLEANAVGTTEIVSNSITASEIAGNAVGSSEIAANAVGTAEVATNAIAAAQLQASAVTAVADGSIDADALAANSVDSAELISGSIDTIHIGSLQVTAAKIAADAISTVKLADNAVTAKETEIITTRGSQETARLSWLNNFNSQVNAFIKEGTLGTNERVYTEENLNIYTLQAYNVYKNLESAPYTFKRSSTVDGEGDIGEDISAYDALGRNQGFITNFTSWREYENANNEARRQLVVVKPEFIERFAEEYRDLITS